MNDGTYKVDGKHAVVRDGRLVLLCDEDEARAFEAWLRQREHLRQRDDATAIATGLGIEGVGGDA
jgi:hypothetical protein